MDIRDRPHAGRDLDMAVASAALMRPPVGFEFVGDEWRRWDRLPGSREAYAARIWPPRFSADAESTLLLVEALQAAHGLDLQTPMVLQVQGGTWYAAFLRHGRDVAWATDDNPLLAICAAAIALAKL